MNIGAGLLQFAILQKEKLFQRLSRYENGFQLPVHLPDSARVLICLPKQTQNPEPLIQSTRKLFPQQFLLFCSPVPLPDNSGMTFITYDSLPLTFWRTQANLRKSAGENLPPHLAVDLNPEFVLPAALLCKACGAPLRISAAKEYASLFFNLILGKGSAEDVVNLPALTLNQLRKLIQ